MQQRQHLDLGCGTKPRNPYGYEKVFGIDIRAGLTAPGVEHIAAANLSCEPIPFESNRFDSVSAYDFLEHIPRVHIDAQGQTHFPFIQLMNEIWRVLKPGGLFYAVFPAYPHELSFADPTHVNVLTIQSHRYFTGKEPMAKMYGFEGRFKQLRQTRLHPRGVFHPGDLSANLKLKRIADYIMQRRSHIMWEWVSE